MIVSTRVSLSTAGVLAGVLAFGAGSALAQQNSISSAGPSGVQTAAGADKGVGRVRMPTADPSVVAVGGSGAPVKITGQAGSSDELDDDGKAPSAFGTSSLRWPFTVSRVAVQQLGTSNAVVRTPVTSRPFRLTGKLWARFDAASGLSPGWYVCTASLIKKSLLVSAAHCVHNYGHGNAGFAKEVLWYPANVADSLAATEPFGEFVGRKWYVPTTYKNGNDTCEAGAIGVVCNNDISVIVLNHRGGVHASTTLGGTYAYSWNGYGFTPPSPAFGNSEVAAITQLGYPVAFDQGRQMERTDSFGKYISGTGTNNKQLKNIQLGSPQTGGSSGGPWLVNFGTTPAISSAAKLGSEAGRNTVMATTSWGFIAVGVGVQGASFFGQNAEFPNGNYGGRGAGNIGALVNTACTAFPTYC